MIRFKSMNTELYISMDNVLYVTTEKYSDVYIVQGHLGWLPVTHVCNASYSGSRDQEDHSSKPVQVKEFHEILSPQKTLHQNNARWSGSR
jgi:hypothetical protein